MRTVSLLFRTILLYSMILLLSACSPPSAGPPAKPVSHKRPPHQVSVMTARRQPVSSRHTRTGQTEVRQIARIYSQEEGRIIQFSWFEGDRVKAGDILVKLDNTLLQAELEKARASARQAKLDLQRIKNLITRKVASEEELSRAKTALEVARAEVHILQTRLQYTTIKAPWNGIVSARKVEPGDVVAKNTHMLSLINPASIQVKARLSEQLLPLVQINDAVDLRIDALGNRHIPGHIRRIHPVIEAGTGQGIVEIGFDSLPETVMPGQFVRVTFSTQPVERLLLPFNSIQQGRSGEFVYVVENRKARKQAVKTGIRFKDQLEIIDGIDSGQQVIVKGFLGLSDGKKVAF